MARAYAPRGTTFLALATGAVALGCGDRAPQADVVGDWTGLALAASTDCAGVPGPPPMERFVLRVEADAVGGVTVALSPIVRMRGRVDRDSLVARAEIDAPVHLPDSLRDRASADDSLDMVTYELRAAITGDEYRGIYRVRNVDLQALLEDRTDLRCEYRYEIAGRREGAVTPGATGGSP